MMSRKVFASYLMPLILGMILIDVFRFGFLNQLFFMLAFFWPFTMLYPGLHEKVQRIKYRFSTLRLFFLYNSIFMRFAKVDSSKGKIIFLRGCAPISLLLISYLTAQSGNIIFIFAGFCLFEICHYFVQKIFKGSFLIPTQIFETETTQLELGEILNPKEWLKKEPEIKSDQEEN
ncbi:MAG: hypothetical protein KC493_02370 [Bacteriovoracaceae bacterium]|nr:hypothetical protein [Bacteriovoracaceae bacterium]